MIQKKKNILVFVLMGLLAVSCGGTESEIDEGATEVEPAPTTPTNPYVYVPPIYDDNDDDHSSDDDDSDTDPLPGDLSVGTHVLVKATDYTNLFAGKSWSGFNYYAGGSSIEIKSAFARKGDVIEINPLSSIRTGERSNNNKNCDKRKTSPVVVRVGSKTYTLFPPLFNKATLTEDGGVTFETPSLFYAKNRPCIVLKNLTIKIHAK